MRRVSLVCFLSRFLEEGIYGKSCLLKRNFEIQKRIFLQTVVRYFVFSFRFLRKIRNKSSKDGDSRILLKILSGKLRSF